jgi:hypothetical protein
MTCPWYFQQIFTQKIHLFRVKIFPKTLFIQGSKSRFNLLCQILFQILRVWVWKTHSMPCLW